MTEKKGFICSSELAAWIWSVRRLKNSTEVKLIALLGELLFLKTDRGRFVFITIHVILYQGKIFLYILNHFIPNVVGIGLETAKK